jgi:protein O-GlcNAc transferase
MGKHMTTIAEALTFGRRCQQAGDFQRAEQVFQQIVKAAPALAEGWDLLGRACLSLGKRQKAVASYRQAIQLRPDLPRSQCNLGLALMELGQWDDALVAIDEALRLDPLLPVAHNNRGAVLQQRNQLDEAVTCYQRAVELRPDFTEAHFNLANVLKLNRRWDEAVASYQQAVRTNPNDAKVQTNLGNTLKDQGRLDEALACFRAAIAAAPTDAAWHSNLLLAMLYHPDLDAASIFAEHQRWAEQHARPAAAAVPTSPIARQPGDRLRIGYVSPDFRKHVVAFFFEPILEAHDRERFEITCYAEVARPDIVTARLQKHADRWRSLVGLSDAQAADLIRQDNIDILVDLAGHTANNRLLVFAHKPAPIQITYLGYMTTTAVPGIDHRLTDAHTDPPGMSERFHTEELVRLPEIAWCYRPPTESPEVNESPVLTAGHITFGSMHNLAKITAPVIAVWSRILTELSDARLLLVTGVGPQTDQRLREDFARHGIDPGRLRLVGKRRHLEYLKLYQQIDICLDAFPFTGCTTTCEALWMGVPVVTLAGTTYTSRQGVSLLTHLELTDLIAATPENYIEIATRLARDPAALRDLRAGLRARMQHAPLTDPQRFTRGLEETYLALWEKRRTAAMQEARRLHQAGHLPEAEQAYRRTLRIDPGQAQVWYLLGVACHGQGKVEEAVAGVREAARLRPDHAETHNHLGVLLAQLGKIDEAAECFHRALELRPDYGEARRNANLVRQRSGT